MKARWLDAVYHNVTRAAQQWDVRIALTFCVLARAPRPTATPLTRRPLPPKGGAGAYYTHKGTPILIQPACTRTRPPWATADARSIRSGASGSASGSGRAWGGTGSGMCAVRMQASTEEGAAGIPNPHKPLQARRHPWASPIPRPKRPFTPFAHCHGLEAQAPRTSRRPCLSVGRHCAAACQGAQHPPPHPPPPPPPPRHCPPHTHPLAVPGLSGEPLHLHPREPLLFCLRRGA